MVIMRLEETRTPLNCEICSDVASGHVESYVCSSCRPEHMDARSTHKQRLEIVRRSLQKPGLGHMYNAFGHLGSQSEPGNFGSGERDCQFCKAVSTGEKVHLYFCLPCSFAYRSKSKRSCSAAAKLTLSFVQQLDPSPLDDDFTGDVAFVVEGCDRPIQAHRYILASKSPVFKAMMARNMKEKNSGEIVIEGMSAAVVRAAVNFMYTGDIKFNDQVRPQDVMRFAHLYDVGWLKEVCETELTSNITVGNLPEIFTVSYELGLENLKDKATEFLMTCKHRDAYKGILDMAFAKQ